MRTFQRSSHAHPRSLVAHKHRPAASVRSRWLVLLDAARTVAGRVSGATVPPAGSATIAELSRDLGKLRRDLRAVDFPAGEVSAKALAEALLAACDAMSAAGQVSGAGRQALCAEVVKVTAEAVWDVLSELQTAEAQGDRRRIPD